MNKGILVAGLFILGLSIVSGILANSDYHDPVGIALLIAFPFSAGLAIGVSFLGENESDSKETTTEDAKHKVG